MSKQPSSMVPTLILIDVQKGFQTEWSGTYWGVRNNLHFEENLDRLLRFWRTQGFPLIHVQHVSTESESPLRPGQEGVEFMEFAQPKATEPVITKSVNSAFIGTDLESRLRSSGVNHVVLAGLTSDHCVSTTTRMAKNLGFQVTIPHDATATFERISYDGTRFDADLVHRVSLASLNREFATIRSTAEICKSTNTGVK